MSIRQEKWSADLYQEKHSFVFEYGEELIDFLNPKYKERILDLGCGSGQLTKLISKSGASVVGIDNSKEMISAAKKKYPDLHFLVKDATNFQFEKPFDAIFSNAVLHWVRNCESAILSMRKNLKIGGRLVVEFGGKGNVQIIIDQIKISLRARGFVKNANIENWYFPSISEYSSLLEKNGFEVEFAHLYDRLTELADNENGIRDWIEMFGSSFFADIPEEDKNDILEEVQNNVREKCFIDGKWIADYKRIRVLARKL